jgi:hypothetical protein
MERLKEGSPATIWHGTGQPQLLVTVAQSRRARYDQAHILSQRYFASKGAPCFLRKANHSNHRNVAHTGANQTVPYGTALLRWPQALRAWLRSDRPSGTGGMGAKPLRGNKSCQNLP